MRVTRRDEKHQSISREIIDGNQKSIRSQISSINLTPAGLPSTEAFSDFTAWRNRIINICGQINVEHVLQQTTSVNLDWCHCTTHLNGSSTRIASQPSVSSLDNDRWHRLNTRSSVRFDAPSGPTPTTMTDDMKSGACLFTPVVTCMLSRAIASEVQEMKRLFSLPTDKR
jgi:hypothetical protein